MKNKSSKPSASKPSAFSLIELSIVLIIIGLLAGGIVAGSVLVKRARIESAKSLTNKSPIKATENLAMWFEGSLSDSFANGQSTNGTSISNGWNNIGGSSDTSSATVDGTAPIYANSINSIPAVKFEGNNALKVGAGAINSSDYTIMITEQRESNKADNYLLGDPSITGTNQNLLIGYKTDGTIVHSQGGTTTSYTSAINGYASYAGARILVFTHSSTEGNKTYINGVLAGKLSSSVAKEHIADLANLAIGKNYIGQIGELAVFKRALSATEITDISDYMSNKWRIKVDTKNTDCSAGIVTENGCDSSSCPISIAGISKTSVDGTASTSTLSCDKTGYTGSITYSCINKTFATTPANATCSCATGYTLVSGSCVTTTCTLPTDFGYTAKSNLTFTPSGSSNFTCDAVYPLIVTSGSVTYSCSSIGLATIIANNCELNANFSNFGAYNITIPSYTKTATIKVCGAKGGGGNGGNGGCVSGSFAIVGDKINNSTALGIYVGNSITGYNGGGWGNHAYTDSYPGTGIYGGGSTDVRTSSDIANRIIVGGGGGGSAGDSNYLGGGGGAGNAGSNSLGTGYGGGGGLGYGSGGHPGGSNGGGEVVCFQCGGGSGGGLNGGGARSCNNWTYNICAGNGSSGNGGNGSTSAWWATHYCTTAGGGGGYYGGGGSSTGRCGGGGGGGGSSFIYNGSTNQVFNGGAHNSNIGYAEIKFKK